MRSWFQFGNIKFDINDGLVIEKVPNQDRPARKMDVYNVPGRNGDIVVMQDAWENVDQTYEIWGGDSNINSATAFGYKAARLFQLTGYQKLTDSYDTTHYRKAYFAGPFDVESSFTRRGRAELTFSCDPRRFQNQEYIEYMDVNHWPLMHGSPYTARPVLTLHNGGLSGAGSITAGGKTLNISNVVEGMVIDCENYIAYLGTTNLNYLISGDFPEFPGGASNQYFYVDWTGAIAAVGVYYNWWEL